MPYHPPRISKKSLNACIQRILSPARALQRVKASRVPENGWTDEVFRTRNGRALIRDLIVAQRVSTAKGIRTLSPRLTRWFDQLVEQIIREFTQKFHNQFGRRAVDEWDTKRLTEVVLEPGAHEAMWQTSIEQVMREKGLDFVSINTNAVQSTLDSSHAATINLLGVTADRGARARLNTRVRSIASRVTRINDTTRDRLNSIINRSIDDGHTVAETAKRLRTKFKDFSRSRVSMIARTEMGQAADAGRKQALLDSGVVSHVSVIGCEAREPGNPTYNGENTCNIQDVPVRDVDKLDFHPNHTGTIVPSRFVDEETATTPPERVDPTAHPEVVPEAPPEVTPAKPEVDPTAGHGTVLPTRISPEVSGLNLQKGLDAAEKNLKRGKGIYSAEARSLGISEDELLDRMDTKLEDILSKEKTVMATRVDSYILDDVIDSGRFKNQFETGATLGGSTDLTTRKSAERRLFGLSREAKGADRPIYGYVGRKDSPFRSNQPRASELNQYGDIAVIFKDKVRERTTWVGGDSFNVGSLAASPVNAPSGLALPNVGFTPERLAEEIARASILDVNSIDNAALRGSYFETQFWGTLSVDDIKEVLVPRHSSLSEELIEKLKEAGVKWSFSDDAFDI